MYSVASNEGRRAMTWSGAFTVATETRPRDKHAAARCRTMGRRAMT
jgi:hypothetical protein